MVSSLALILVALVSICGKGFFGEISIIISIYSESVLGLFKSWFCIDMINLLMKAFLFCLFVQYEFITS